MIFEIIFAVLMGCCVFIVVGTHLYFKKDWFKSFFHDFLEWHKPINDLSEFDGCSNKSVCKHCGKTILQDSQGNWF